MPIDLPHSPPHRRQITTSNHQDSSQGREIDMSKRDRDGNARPKDGDGSGSGSGGRKTGPREATALPESRFSPMFHQFRDELDEHHDRKERIVKVSRDVTALSKKIIFACQRVNKLGDLPQRTQAEIDSRMSEIQKLLSSIEPDLTTLNRHRYATTLRCLEELVEALSFAHYLQTQTLISPGEASARVPAAVSLTDSDYLYGIFDLFGEMMRFATVTTAQNGQLAGGDRAGDGQGDGAAAAASGQGQGQGQGRRDILMDFHELSGAFEVLPTIHERTYHGKMEAMRTSVKKVEKLGYGIAIRGSERPRGWLPDMKDDVGAAD